MFRVEMLPAAQGDCLWIEFGDAARPRRILIDTGTRGTYRALARRLHDLPPSRRHIDLFVVTHIDSDHIGAATHLLDQRPCGLSFGDVWFNGFGHLPGDHLGVADARRFSRALEDHELCWNAAFGGAAVCVRDDGALPTWTMDGMRLTVMSPYTAHLAALRQHWETELQALDRRAAKSDARRITRLPEHADRLGRRIDVAALAEAPFDNEDDSVPNGSSIALLAEYDGCRVLLGADAFPGTVERSIDRLLQERGGLGSPGSQRLTLDAFKLCHHGSARNTSPMLAHKLAARCLLVSSNGAYHEHPNDASIARLLHFGDGQRTRLLFNYRTDFNNGWDDPVLIRRHALQVLYRLDTQAGLAWSADDR